MHLLKDENGNIIPHGAEHTHEHSHEDGHTHTHPHTHEHGHEDDHHHDHEHGCEGSCDTGCSGCSGAAQDPKAQLTALLGYMLNHNESHARELDEMAGKIAEAGMPEAAEQIRKGVAEFQKGKKPCVSQPFIRSRKSLTAFFCSMSARFLWMEITSRLLT